MIGLPLLAGTGLLVWLWRSPDAAPHGRGFALGALWLGMGALAFLLSAGAIRLGWRAWWIVQLLPLLWAAPFVASFL
ncbi:hypothetical protein [Longimicrobium terrae]|uniref:Uncharacterized protein n=1 Tax=Longimicrobium terrae TaxID=1639882 RepID=A0A841GWS4_9BACT|nr:hypothetical protein [Longimicrobium terrae]MBB4634244.1 hypothetical protein [Longimicrobium terrae]MBB6068866.1 hypothetical protein [Longimicrobium terrae]NNC28046.1 hypothetical protein [Longimicrobium terrae]